MFAISFDMVIVDLKKNYGEPYNNAYFEIGKALIKYEFYNTQGSVYLSQNSDMSNLFRAMNELRKIDWFKNNKNFIYYIDFCLIVIFPYVKINIKVFFFSLFYLFWALFLF